MQKFKLKKPDSKFPKNEYYKLNTDGTKYVPDPLEIPSKTNPNKKLWEERLVECRKTNPECTLEDMGWGIADIPVVLS